MARNVFVSYKYADENAQYLFGHFPTKARHYVDEIEKLLAAEGHIFYGEHDGEDLSDWSEDKIWQELKDRIFPTTITIVLISPNMKEDGKYDRSQWIPWEICYSLRETVRSDMKSHRNAILAVVLPDKQGNYESLRETVRSDMKSHRNAILAVVLPDKQGNYEYALKSNTCCETGCTTYIRDWMFTIIKENLFNRKQANIVSCQNNTRIRHGEYSYIPMVRWDYFKSHVTSLIERAERIKDDYEKNDSYNLHLSVNK